MNKKLLAAAIAASVVAAPAAFADSVLYGSLHTSIDAQDFETGGNVDNWATNSRASRIGVKGSEDLGNGLKAIYQIEFQYDSDGGLDQAGGTLTGQRNTFVGLAGSWGTFLVGKHDTPAKLALYAGGNELLGFSVIDFNGTATDNKIGVFHEFRANNAIAYVSPNFAGFTLAAAIVPGEQSGTNTGVPGTPANDNDGAADHYSLGLMYKGGGLKAGVGYESKVQLNNVVGGQEAEFETMQVGASYSFGMFQVGAQYESSDDNLFVLGDDYTAFAVTGKATFGNSAVSLIYTDAELERTGANNDTESKGWGLAAEHNFSKRTKVYAAYADNSVDNQGAADTDDTVFSIGMIHDF